MHMGNLKGHRYSSLTQVSKANVGTLKLAWKVDLGYCSTNNAACGSFEANAVVSDGTYYIQDPFGAVYALRRRHGRQALEVDAHLRGRLRPRLRLEKPGVAIGEGKVFAGLADGQLYGLDQVDGWRALGRRK